MLGILQLTQQSTAFQAPIPQLATYGTRSLQESPTLHSSSAFQLPHAEAGQRCWEQATLWT